MVRAVLVIPVPAGGGPSSLTVKSAGRQTRQPDETVLTSPSHLFMTKTTRAHRPPASRKAAWGAAAGLLHLAAAEVAALHPQTAVVAWRNGRVYHPRAVEDALAAHAAHPDAVAVFHARGRDGKPFTPGPDAKMAAAGEATFGAVASAKVWMALAAALPAAPAAWEDLLRPTSGIKIVVPAWGRLPSKATYSRFI